MLRRTTRGVRLSLLHEFGRATATSDSCTSALWVPPSQANCEVLTHRRDKQHSSLQQHCGFVTFAAQPLCATIQQAKQANASYATRTLLTSAAPLSDAAIEVQQVLQTLSAAEFRKLLRKEADIRPDMSYDEWAEYCRQCNIAHSEQDVAQLLKTLSAAGVVLHFQERVYLNPKEIAETILSALRADFPSNPDGSMQKLAVQLQELEDKRDQVVQQVDRRVSWVLWGVAAMMFGQLGAFTYFTFILHEDYGWDIVEPVSFHIIYGFTVASYLYFLLTRQEFTWEAFRDKLRTRELQKLSSEYKFDVAEYERLAQKLRRHQHLLLRAAK